jgi:phage terminase large subunit-like protein
MRHATPEDLKPLAALLAQLRTLPGLTEKKPGTFYKKSAAFLHFHEDAGALYADIKQDGTFVRHVLDSAAAQAKLLTLARRLLNAN